MSEEQWQPDEADLSALWSAVAGASGDTALGSRITHRDVQRASTTVAARVDVTRPDGSRATDTYCASTSAKARAAMRVSDGVRELGVWRFPHDPALPGLARAVDPGRMRELLAGLGLPTEDLRPTVRSYRPLRRAVVEVRTARATVFVKVLRPDKVQQLHRLHRAAEGGVVPESLGWTDDGLLVLAGVGGTSLRRLLLGGNTMELDRIDPADIVATLHGLPQAFADHARRRSWAEQAGHYADVIARVHPGAAGTAHAVAEAVAVPTGAAPVPVHGDFYETQLLVSGGRLVGLLDIDTAGAGDPHDDPACLLGHLSVLSQVKPERAPVIDRFTARCLREFDRHWDPVTLRSHAAAVVLSLAPGAHRTGRRGWHSVLERRLDLAWNWCRADDPLTA
ncbi:MULTISPECIES: phosphotransferase family protein [Prauserella salsuginis group]|uniref:Aminoglycoside phosphotransferase domain-containing protein n=2 Tax=Prauserella salsuginis group TaxID=2893672 RepID=A0A839XK88_9PSEU|nr:MULTISPECIES: phosphotransferase [Prauserella salsuginis group]MBB3662967.1 hypothetical protein [Prauserella sediminis]MCR3721297.1 Phosphotransferase enzyme family protein [Prauserella flava]MCR3734623.1 Phosphotransferase enzyme family protein [Prauserella salsuginis]